MRHLIRSPIAAIFIVAIMVVMALPQMATVNSNGNALVQTQAQTMVLAARGDVIKEIASSVLNSSGNVTLTALAYLPSTTIKRAGDADATFTALTYLPTTTIGDQLAAINRDVGIIAKGGNTMNVTSVTTTFAHAIATTPLDVGITNSEITVNTTTATTVNTAMIFPDVGFVSENSNGDFTIDAQALTNTDNTGAMQQTYCANNFATTTMTANIRAATTDVLVTIDRETFALAAKRTSMILRV